jgi:hypothetical protein
VALGFGVTLPAPAVDFVLTRRARVFFVVGALAAFGALAFVDDVLVSVPASVSALVLRIESTSFWRVLSVFVMMSLSPG